MNPDEPDNAEPEPPSETPRVEAPQSTPEPALASEPEAIYEPRPRVAVAAEDPDIPMPRRAQQRSMSPNSIARM